MRTCALRDRIYAHLAGADRRGDRKGVDATALESAPAKCAAFCVERRMTDVGRLYRYLSVEGGFLDFDLD